LEFVHVLLQAVTQGKILFRRQQSSPSRRTPPSLQTSRREYIIELLSLQKEQPFDVVWAQYYRTVHRSVQGETPPDLLRYVSIQASDGYFPVTLAVKSGKQWIGGGIKKMYDAYPDALDQVDQKILLLIIWTAS
jgi:hypothetical protein